MPMNGSSLPLASGSMNSCAKPNSTANTSSPADESHACSSEPPRGTNTASGKYACNWRRSNGASPVAAASRIVAERVKTGHRSWKRKRKREDGEEAGETSVRLFSDAGDEFLERWDLLGL